MLSYGDSLFKAENTLTVVKRILLLNGNLVLLFVLAITIYTLQLWVYFSCSFIAAWTFFVQNMPGSPQMSHITHSLVES